MWSHITQASARCLDSFGALTRTHFACIGDQIPPRWWKLQFNLPCHATKHEALQIAVGWPGRWSSPPEHGHRITGRLKLERTSGGHLTLLLLGGQTKIQSHTACSCTAPFFQSTEKQPQQLQYTFYMILNRKGLHYRPPPATPNWNL